MSVMFREPKPPNLAERTRAFEKRLRLGRYLFGFITALWFVAGTGIMLVVFHFIAKFW